MKKTYIIPASLTVQLDTMQMMALSMKVNNEPTDPVIESPDDILTKGMNDIDLWDDEW